jgi:hypothetical protein
MKNKPSCLLIVLFSFANLHSVPAQNPAFIFSSLPGVGSDPQCVIAADVNGDGELDLISANFHDGTLTVLTNNGSGDFALASSPNIQDASFSVCAADVNGDEQLDLVSANLNGTLTLSTNNGNGSFGSISLFQADHFPDSVCAADVNGDGKLDLIGAYNYGDNFNSTLTVLTNDGHGGFVIASSPIVGIEAQCVVAADVNGDGKVDLISANYGNAFADGIDSTLTAY